MARLRLIRDTSRDFTVHGTRTGTWRGLVWSATPDLFRLGREDAGLPPVVRRTCSSP
jgi:hypothetical protein